MPTRFCLSAPMVIAFRALSSLHEAYTKPTQSLHDFGVLQRGNKNQLTHLQVFCFLQAKKFSREYCLHVT